MHGNFPHPDAGGRLATRHRHGCVLSSILFQLSRVFAPPETQLFFARGADYIHGMALCVMSHPTALMKSAFRHAQLDLEGNYPCDIPPLGHHIGRVIEGMWDIPLMMRTSRG